MGTTTAEYADGGNRPQPEIIGCPPNSFAAGTSGDGGNSDAELALALQLAEMQEAEESAAHAASMPQQDQQLMLSDPVWGDLHFLGKDPTCWDKLCFGCCPCFIVGCTGALRCCIPGQVTSSMDPMRAWKRVLSCCSLWISVSQIVIFIMVVVFMGGFVPMDQNQMLGP